MAAQVWNSKLFKTPRYRKAKGFDGLRSSGVQPIFYDCGKWKGRKVEAFAWLGLPKLEPGRKCPGIVLVHGGGGTAFADWVELWNSRGYAAISMDNCGGVPCWNENAYSKHPWPRHKHSGPAGWGDFENANSPIEDQWPYQATATVIAAHSLLRSLPEVDSARIGLTGVSWGGVLTCMAAGIDSRFAFAAPVYGAGFLNPLVFTEGMPPVSAPEKNAKWLELWDPSLYLANAKIPFLWTVGSNDFAFNLDSLAKSAELVKAKSGFCIPIRMGHGHGGLGEKPPEILDFANRVLSFGESLDDPELSEVQTGNGVAELSFKPGWKAAKAEFNYALGREAWKDRLWETASAKLDISTGRISASLPSGATAFYFSLFSEKGLIFSSKPCFDARGR